LNKIDDNSNISLSLAKEGDHCIVNRIETENEKKLQILLSMNILPGRKIIVLQTFPSRIFQVGETQYAVDSSISDAIFVKILKSTDSHIIKDRNNKKIEKRIFKTSSLDIFRKLRLF